MMFDRNDTMKASAENAFNTYLAERGDIENEYTYLQEECEFTNPLIFSKIEDFERRAKAIIEIADDTVSVGPLADAFEGLSFYMQTSDAYDSESYWLSTIPNNVDEMLSLFEQLTKSS